MAKWTLTTAKRVRIENCDFPALGKGITSGEHIVLWWNVDGVDFSGNKLTITIEAGLPSGSGAIWYFDTRNVRSRGNHTTITCNRESYAAVRLRADVSQQKGCYNWTMDRDTILVDWGTSALRAWRVGSAADVRDERVDPRGGIAMVADGAFEAALRQQIGDWLQPGTRVWLSGMVTSRNGWVEVPYVPVPVRLADLAARAVERRLDDGVRLHFVPGVCTHVPTPDVMRGEEVQVCVGTAQHVIKMILMK